MMQVQSRLPPGSHHPASEDYQNQVRVNGDSKPTFSPSTGRQFHAEENGNGMHPYQQQQHYAAPPPGPPQQRQYASNQLPPMYPSMNMAPMPGASSSPHGMVYNPGSQPPPQARHPIQQQHEAQQGQQLSVSSSNGKYNFELIIDQQPARARMCGFGDKDRRPITPPPCIKLVVTDMAGNIVPPSDVDGSFFVLQVDLWDTDATHEVNIVRSSSTSPAVSISTATMTSYPPVPERPPVPEYQNVMYTANGQAIFQPPQAYPPPGMGYAMPGTMPGYYAPAMPSYMPGTTGQGSNMYTRNLIGSLTVNAAVLKDPEGEQAFWFVLQDLSVRTEGFFRLKMNFIDVSNPAGEGLNRGRAPILAYVFSDKFQVYSAKKFPGVIESTPLSKCFASQGIKIPIRKDVKTEQDDDDDDGA